MKRIVAITLVVLLLLTGCGRRPDAHELSQSLAGGFRCVAEIDFGGEEYKAQLSCQKGGGCSIELLEPELLKGLSVNWEDGKLTMEAFGFSIGVDTSKMPDIAWSRLLADVFSRVIREENLRVEKSEDEFTLSGGTEEGEFSLSFDRKTFALRSLSIPSVGLKVSFDEFAPANN